MGNEIATMSQRRWIDNEKTTKDNVNKTKENNKNKTKTKEQAAARSRQPT